MINIDNIEETSKLLEQMKDFFTNLDIVKKDLEHDVTIKEYEQEDLLHELELSNLNAIEVMRVTKRLIQTRRDRRTIKNKLEFINTLKGLTDKYINKGICSDLNQTIQNVENLQKVWNERGYTARVLKDLKCNKQKLKEQI